MIRRFASTASVQQIEPLLGEWEQWAAELLESQLSFPVLAFYRSQHDNQNWLGRAGGHTRHDFDPAVELPGCEPPPGSDHVRDGPACSGRPRADLSRERTENTLRSGCRRSSITSFCMSCTIEACELIARMLVRAAGRIADDVRAVYYRTFEILRVRVAAGHCGRGSNRQLAAQPVAEQSPGIGALPSIRPEDHFV